MPSNPPRLSFGTCRKLERSRSWEGGLLVDGTTLFGEEGRVPGGSPVHLLDRGRLGGPLPAPGSHRIRPPPRQFRPLPRPGPTLFLSLYPTPVFTLPPLLRSHLRWRTRGDGGAGPLVIAEALEASSYSLYYWSSSFCSSR